LVDRDAPVHAPLGQHDEYVAGAKDLVYPSDGGGAVGQRGDRLRSADGVDLVDAGDVRRRQDRVVHLAATGRAGHDDLGDAGHSSRDCCHQERGRIGRAPVGRIDADAFQRPHQLSQTRTGAVPVHPSVARLPAVKLLDARCAGFKRLPQAGGRAFPGQGDALRGYPERFGYVAVEQLPIVSQRLVPSGAHVADDPLDHLVRRKRLTKESANGLGQTWGSRYILQGAAGEQRGTGRVRADHQGHERIMAPHQRPLPEPSPRRGGPFRLPCGE